MVFQAWRKALGRWLLAEPAEGQTSRASSALEVLETRPEAALEVGQPALPDTTIPQHWLDKVSAGPPAHWLKKVQEGAPDLWESLAADLVDDPTFNRLSEGSQPGHAAQDLSDTISQSDISVSYSPFSEEAAQPFWKSLFSRSREPFHRFKSSLPQSAQSAAAQTVVENTSQASSLTDATANASFAEALSAQASRSQSLFSSDGFSSDGFSFHKTSSDNLSRDNFSQNSLMEGSASSSIHSLPVPSPPVSSLKAFLPSRPNPKLTAKKATASIIRSISSQTTQASPKRSQRYPSLRFSSPMPPASDAPAHSTDSRPISPSAPLKRSVQYPAQHPAQYPTTSPSPPSPHPPKNPHSTVHRQQSGVSPDRPPASPCPPANSWPPLPSLPAPPPKSATCDRRHHQRLDQEQQGKSWNELRF